MRVESAGWSGEGEFTAVVLESLKGIDAIEFLRVEDAPASRAEPGYAFVSNEIYVRFRRPAFAWASRLLGRLRVDGRTRDSAMTLAELGRLLGGLTAVGEPDYADDGLLQFLKAERIIAPHQSKGIKVVELVRIYEAGSPPRA